MEETPHGPLPSIAQMQRFDLPPMAFDACPGRGVNYPDLYSSIFGRLPKNWLLGCYRDVYIGYSCVPAIRRRGASGGVITQALVYLLEQGLVDGAVVVRQGSPRPWQAEPLIARSVDEILAASQSVYVPVPVNSLLPRMEAFDGRLAYVGLPDQVASLRRLQQLGHPGAQKVAYILGPYVGTCIYFGAVESYLKSNGVRNLEEVVELRYREGEWPGHLQVKLRSGEKLRADKFHYNYLIPFYITQSSLIAVDFTNELTDISVGDAWHPRYEAQREGFSVVVVRSERGESLLSRLFHEHLISLENISLAEALSMHGHMLDFKKRGTFIRLGWRQAVGRRVPDYGYRPQKLPVSRRFVEVIIFSIFAVCRTKLARRLLKLVPVGVIGPFFDLLRKAWKSVSKPTKRKGLGCYKVDVRP
jgi:coenzyme F420 hydrogenase subunit beta